LRDEVPNIRHQHAAPEPGDQRILVVKDATTDYSDEMMHAALDINMPNYAAR
jgi:hypothetical protein